MKGSIGTQTNSVIHIKKPKPIFCDCEKCGHSKKRAGTIHCTYFDIISPKRKKCIRYIGPTTKKTKKK